MLLAGLIALALIGCRPTSPVAEPDATAEPQEDNQTVDTTAPAAEADLPDGPDAWPLFRGDPLASGVARSTLSEKPEVVWKRSFEGGAFEATAAIVDGSVYVGGVVPDGNFYALDLANGEIRWTYTTESGFYASAAVRDGRVYVGDADGRFLCFDAATGEMCWHFEAQAEINSSANFFGEHVLFGSQDATLYCLNSQSGELVWKYAIDDQIRCSPTVVENRCFIAGCDSKLHVVDLNRGDEAAEVPIDAQTGCTPAVLGDRVYFGTEGETFYCIDWREAEIIWSYRHPQRRFPYRASAAVTEGSVVFGGRDRILRSLHPISGELQWEYTARARFDSSPVIVGQRVYVASSDGRLFGLGLTSGEVEWEYEAGGGFLSSPAVAEGRLVIGNEDGTLYCFGTP